MLSRAEGLGLGEKGLDPLNVYRSFSFLLLAKDGSRRASKRYFYDYVIGR